MDGASHLLFQTRRHQATSQLELQQLLDLADLAALTARAECRRRTAQPRTAGSAYAVNEILWNLR